MKSSEEKRWERMQQVLFAEAQGDAPACMGSQRTLFGIKSHVEEVIERTAAEDAARCSQTVADATPSASELADAVPANAASAASQVSPSNAVAPLQVPPADAAAPLPSAHLHAVAAQNARLLREAFAFDFVGVSVVDDAQQELFEWQYAAGNSNGNFALIHLPRSVGALGKVFESRRGLAVDNVQADIPAGELFQYPIVIAENLSSLFAFPLFGDAGDIRAIVICGQRSVRTLDALAAAAVQRRAAQLFALAPCQQQPVWVHGKQDGFVYTEITHKMLQSQENERRRIACELHDGISQELLVVQIELRKVRYLPQEQWPDAIEAVNEKLRDVMSHVGMMAHALRPSALDELGLQVALQSLCASMADAFDVQVAPCIPDAVDLPADQEIAVYRIVQEALSNACKYARATRIDVSLSQRDGLLELRIADDGQGFDPQHLLVRGSGLGLQGMQERAGLVGGQLGIQSQPGQGTFITLRIRPKENA